MMSKTKKQQQQQQITDEIRTYSMGDQYTYTMRAGYHIGMAHPSGNNMHIIDKYVHGVMWGRADDGVHE